jgi:F-type H+-transporting ATPase subunit epsilon
MAKTFKLEILTLKRTVYSGMIVSVIAPGTIARFGVLVRHAPMISSLEPGILRIREPASKEVLTFVGEGLLKVEKDSVVILAGSAELAYEIDVERATASRDRALNRLNQTPPRLRCSTSGSLACPGTGPSQGCRCILRVSCACSPLSLFAHFNFSTNSWDPPRNPPSGTLGLISRP